MHLSPKDIWLIVQIVSVGLWLPLKVLVIQAILNAGARRYALVFAYSVLTFLIVVVQLPISLALLQTPTNNPWFNQLFFSSQLLTYALMVGVVLSFIYRASDPLPGRHLLRLTLFAGGLLFIAVTGWIHYDPGAALGVWVPRWKRDLNLGAAILDLGLWGMLLASRRPDSRFLLLLTGGMGMMFAGEAIGNAVRDIGISRGSVGVYYLGHAVVVMADAVFLYVWWQAFRREASTREALTAANDQ